MKEKKTETIKEKLKDKIRKQSSISLWCSSHNFWRKQSNIIGFLVINSDPLHER